MNDSYVKPWERLDDLQNGCYVIQEPSQFCFGIDAVLLADFAKARPGEKVLDMGTGTGIIPILMSKYTRGQHFTGLEIQSKCAEMAARSVAYNHLEERIRIVEGDIKDAVSIFGAASFQVITSNPPYMIAEHGLRNQAMQKSIARHEVLCTLRDVVSQASRLLVNKGRFYMVHRPFRLPEILDRMLEYSLEPKRMRFVHPYGDREPNMVLIEAVRGGNPRMQVEPPLIVYERPGVYSKEILDIYHVEAK